MNRTISKPVVRKKVRSFWAICVVLSTVLTYLPQDLQAQISFACRVDSNKMLIGDQRSLYLELSPAGTSPGPVDFSAWESEGVEILDNQQWNQSSDGFEQQLTFAVFDTGYVVLPPLLLQIEGDSIYSNDLALEVQGIMLDSTGLAPIKPILKEPVRLSDFLIYIIVFLVGLLIIGLVFLRRKYTAVPEEIVEVPLPPHQIAMISLEKLKNKKLWQQGKIKEYQSELTHIIREYLENRFKIRALESTTGEIMSALRRENQVRDWLEQLSQILNMADMIKFAKAKPELGVHDQFMQMAESFIIGTRETEHSVQTEEEE